MKIKALIASIACILIVGVIAILLYCFWPAIKGTVDNSKYYTAEELQEAYDKGYDDGCKTETELTGQVEYYKELVDEYYIQVNTLNDEISTLNDNIRQKDEQISSLTNTKNSLESSIEGLNGTIKENEQTIKDNESEIESLNGQIQGLQKQIKDKETEEGEKDKEIERLGQQIETLKGRISSLESLNTQLEQTNQTNLSTITTLNIQIKSLNEQIVELSKQVQGNSGLVSSLNAQIAQMEKTIEYYENYIKQLESGNQVVATFEYDGSVINVQILAKGGKASITDPETTRYLIFNYWMVDGQKVNLSEYVINQNTKFVANLTYKYDVKFMIDGQQYKETQLIEKGQYPTLPEQPSKDGYEFDYWTVDGILEVEVESYEITKNTTFIAKFTQIHNVKFNDGVNTHDYKVRHGEYLSEIPENPEKEDYEFVGWTLNGEDVVDPKSILIFEDKEFTAKFKPTKLEWKEYGPQYSMPFNFTATPWSDGENIFVSQPGNTVGYQLNKETSLWEERGSIYGRNAFSGDNIWHDGDNVYYSNGSSQYVLDKAQSKFVKKTWNGLTEFIGENIWEFGNKFYYSKDTTHYVLEKGSDTWEKITWNGLTKFDGKYVWTQGENVYYSYDFDQYVLNKDTNTWETKEWNDLMYYGFCGFEVWTDGENTYTSDGSGTWLLDVETSTWSRTKLENYSIVNGKNFWTSDGHIYFGLDFEFIKETQELQKVSWRKLGGIDGRYVWTWKGNYYYSNDISYSTTYVLNKENGEWSKTDWNTTMAAKNIWTDGETLYYSEGTRQYVYDENENKWSIKKWTGLTAFYGENVYIVKGKIYYVSSSKLYYFNTDKSSWEGNAFSGIKNFKTDYCWSNGDNIYYSYRAEQYVLNTETFTWEQKNWNGVNEFYDFSIFVYNEYTFCSVDGVMYLLDKETDTWQVIDIEAKTAEYLWTDGVDIYFSTTSTQLKLGYKE